MKKSTAFLATSLISGLIAGGALAQDNPAPTAPGAEGGKAAAKATKSKSADHSKSKDAKNGCNHNGCGEKKAEAPAK